MQTDFLKWNTLKDEITEERPGLPWHETELFRLKYLVIDKVGCFICRSFISESQGSDGAPPLAGELAEGRGVRIFQGRRHYQCLS
jgi:hypothetical protein